MLCSYFGSKRLPSVIIEFLPSDVCVGSVSSGRSHVSTDTIGCFVNTFANVFHVDRSMTFAELVRQVSSQSREYSEHFHVPWMDVVKALGVSGRERDIFEVVVNSSPVSVSNQPLLLGSHSLIPFSSPFKPSIFEVTIEITNPSTRNLSLEVCFSATVHPVDAKMFALRFEQLWEKMFCLGFAETRLDLVDLRLPFETRIAHSITCASPTAVQAPNFESLFLNSFEKHCDLVAIRDGDRSITYGTLHRMAVKIANKMISEVQVKPRDVIAVSMDSSIEMIACIVGMLFVVINLFLNGSNLNLFCIPLF
jgi:non-ribosomal peptide synthetase component F